MSLLRGRTCGACCGISVVVTLWLSLFLIYIISWIGRPSFCDDGQAKNGVAAAAERPKVYSQDGDTPKIDWSSVSSGWNTACGEVPTDFTALAEKYAKETGGWSIIQDDSAFKKNMWTKYNFEVMYVLSVKPSDDFPCNSVAQSISTFFSINFYFMPTAISEMVGPIKPQYEVCAYFEDPSGKLPWRRLYKTGASDPYVHEMVREDENTRTIGYNSVSPFLNDANDGTVGKCRVTVQVVDHCPVWSQAESAAGLGTFLLVLTLVLVLTCGGCVFGCKQGAFHETFGEEKVELGSIDVS